MTRRLFQLFLATVVVGCANPYPVPQAARCLQDSSATGVLGAMRSMARSVAMRRGFDFPSLEVSKDTETCRQGIARYLADEESRRPLRQDNGVYQLYVFDAGPMGFALHNPDDRQHYTLGLFYDRRWRRLEP